MEAFAVSSSKSVRSVLSLLLKSYEQPSSAYISTCWPGHKSGLSAAGRNMQSIRAVILQLSSPTKSSNKTQTDVYNVPVSMQYHFSQSVSVKLRPGGWRSAELFLITIEYGAWSNGRAVDGGAPLLASMIFLGFHAH